MYPVLFRQGQFVIYTHDFFTTLGLLAGLALYSYELRRRGMFSWRIVCLSVAAIIGGGIGARTITAWEHLPYYRNDAGVPLYDLIAHSGKSIIGGIAGGYLAVVLCQRVLRYRHALDDCFAAAIPLGLVIGRIGCFLTELPLGTPTRLPWGMRASEAAASQFARCPSCTAPMHPSMIYEIVFNAIALVLVVRYRQRAIVQGDALKLYLLAYAAFRFLVEFVRANPAQFGGLSGPQLVLIPLAALLIWHFARNWRHGLYRMPAAPVAATAPRGAAGAFPAVPARRSVAARRYTVDDA